MKTSHFEGHIASSAVETAQGRILVSPEHLTLS